MTDAPASNAAPQRSLLFKAVRVVAIALLSVYLLFGGAVWGWQELLIFPAPTVDPAMLDRVAARIGAVPIHLVAADGTALYGWHRVAQGKKALIFFHGNAETVADRVPLQDWLVERGWDVVIVAYRGYPGSPGEPSEGGLQLDARAAWAYTTGELRIPGGHIVLHGKSLGGGVAAMLAEETEPAGLVLESTFTSISDVAKWRFPIYPAELMTRHPFATRDRAGLIDVPVLIMHGDQDATIPVDHGRQLAKLFPDAEYVEVPGLGHGETLPLVDPKARAAYERFLSRVVAP